MDKFNTEIRHVHYLAVGDSIGTQKISMDQDLARCTAHRAIHKKERNALMPRIRPVPEERLPEELKQGLEVISDSAGFIPDTLMTMAHRPEIVRGYLSLWKAMHEANTLDYQLVACVQYAASSAAGCSYCQAHMAYLTSDLGMDPDKVSAIGDFETDERFSGAERAALRLAFDAGVVPNSVTDEHFKELRDYFDEGQIVELVANISLMGFLNRYNDTMASELEDTPLDFASRHLSKGGWSAGKHAPATV